MWIVKIALQRSYTFIVLAIIIVLLGGYAIAKTATDILVRVRRDQCPRRFRRTLHRAVGAHGDAGHIGTFP